MQPTDLFGFSGLQEVSILGLISGTSTSLSFVMDTSTSLSFVKVTSFFFDWGKSKNSYNGHTTRKKKRKQKQFVR